MGGNNTTETWESEARKKKKPFFPSGNNPVVESGAGWGGVSHLHPWGFHTTE